MNKVRSQTKNLEATYQRIRPSVAAIASRISRRPDFLEIIGTGFVVDEDGLIITCDHVIDEVKKLPRRKEAPPEEWPIVAILFHLFPEGMATMFLEVVGVGKPEEWKRGFDYAPRVPDLGLIKVNHFSLPALELSLHMEKLVEGKRVALAGFPMGTDALRAPGWMHQFTPTLQEGVVAAVMPFPCANPHALLLNIMSQGGSSGSPVFSPESEKVIGMVYGGLEDTYKMGGGKDAKGALFYQVPTTLTTVIPSTILNSFIEAFKSSKQAQEELEKQKFKKIDFKETLKKARSKAKEGKLVIPLQPIDARKIIVPREKK